jgi:ADP-heptose:LPS heptosyltransferase
MGVLKALRQEHPNALIGWATKQEFAPVVGLSQEVNNIFPLAKKSGFKGLMELLRTIKSWSPDVIYDAHQTPRTMFLVLLMKLWGGKFRFIKRSKNRIKRLMLFKLRINKFPKPFRGMISYGLPLQRIGLLNQTWEQNIDHQWKFDPLDIKKVHEYLPDIHDRIALVPSAAWEMKRWPLNHWQQLVRMMPSCKFVVLGGPQDTFCQDIAAVGKPDQVINLAGKLNLAQSCYVVSIARLNVSADTGLIHVADILGRPGICLLGPTAFGHTSSNAIVVMQDDLPCRPCSKDGRGRCHRSTYQECMVNITPSKVAATIVNLIN